MSQRGGERSKARERLREFYKLQQQQQQQTSSTASTTRPATSSQLRQQLKDQDEKQRRSTGSALDIDATAFDSKKYLKKVLVEQGVAGLLQTDNTLVRDIRQIDGDMKTMVYENYSRFITATETIGKMKQDAEFMDAEMAKLSRQINQISERARDVDDKFAERREQINRLSSEHRLLSSLQFLFDLPEELNRLIGRGRFVEAAKIWSRTQPQLEHYRQLGVFANVEKDGKQIMQSVESTIWQRWRHLETGMHEGAECASLLVLLQPQSTSQLWRDYLEIQGAKNRSRRQAILDESYGLPAICSPASDALSPGLAMIEGDRGGTPMPQQQQQQQQQQQYQAQNRGSLSPAAFPQVPDSRSKEATTTSRIAHFNQKYLPVWSSLVIGFASQFVSPAGSGLLEAVDSSTSPSPTQGTTAATPGPGNSMAQGRTMSLLEATTEGTVVGLLSPLAEDAGGSRSLARLAAAGASGQSPPKDRPLVVGWQAMSPGELATAQQEFTTHVEEWAAEYEFIVDSLIQHPDDPTEPGSVLPYLEQLDDLVGTAVGEYPILVRIGGLRECIFRVVERWQRQLIESVLHTIVRDMIERLEYYFDPTIEAVDASSVMGTPVPQQQQQQQQQQDHRSSISRHRRNPSLKSNDGASQASHKRSGSVLSNTWSGMPADRGLPQSHPKTGDMAASPQSPLTIHTQPLQNARGLAHARAVSSAFEALGNSPSVPSNNNNNGSMSPSLGPFSAGAVASGAANPHRLSRASTTTTTAAGRPSGPNTISGALRRARHQHRHRRTLSSALAEMASLDDDSVQQPSMRRSLSVHYGNIPRRYRPWLVGSVNRNAPLHVFLADMESWLIQQILERLNPMLERVVQHYLDIEGSQILDEGGSSEDGREESPRSVRQRGKLPLQMAAKIRQLFIKTLDGCLDMWMSEWIPDSFLYATLANPVFGTKAYVEKQMGTGSQMAQLGLAVVSDPVSSLLLARFAVDFELTLTQSIYQLCEHGILITPDEHQQQQQRSGSMKPVRPYDVLRSPPAGDESSVPVAAVSDVWLSICRWMRHVEEDTNALFYDPVFSATLKPLEIASRLSGVVDPADYEADGIRQQQQQPSLFPGNGKLATLRTTHDSMHAHILSNIDRLFAERVDVFPKSISPLKAGQVLFHLAMQIIKTAVEALRLRPFPLYPSGFQQIAVDAAFVRSWMLRYTGVAPDLASPSSAPAKVEAAGAESPVVNERDARAIHNLVDDWVNSAKAFSVDPTPPDDALVDRLVFNAWMAAYFGQEASPLS
ncbi:hypothetical protein GGF46_001636 [Coemansia sp. RSA 552]|nr:hypothetical protein GGF46_001636 [Coemansia sp. RSA 552]